MIFSIELILLIWDSDDDQDLSLANPMTGTSPCGLERIFILRLQRFEDFAPFMKNDLKQLKR
jgi:hypothetical protein